MSHLRQSKKPRANNPVTLHDNVQTLLAGAACRDLVAAQRANRAKGISSRGVQLLLDAPDHEIADCFGSADAFDEEHSVYLDDDSPAPAPIPTAAGTASGSSAAHSTRVRGTSLTSAYILRLQALEKNWTSIIALLKPLLDDFHLLWQREALHQRLQSLARLTRMIEAYVAEPIHTHLAADGITVVRCNGRCTVNGHDDVWYRNLEHGLSISVPKLECTVCGSKFRMPPSAVM